MSSDDAKSTVRARFFREAVQNDAKTTLEGRPIFDDVEFVEFIYPGDRLQRLVAPAHEVPSQKTGMSYAQMYHRQYDAFKRGDARAVSGTPLEAWPVITASRCAELKASNILSVDELAGVSDAIVSRLGPGSRELREQARAFIESAKGGAATSAMAIEIARLKSMVERLSEQSNPAPAPVEKTEKPIADCTDDELKAFIKERTGEAPRGNINRSTLEERATALVTEKEAA